ncbi:MAG: spinster family MFS transporter [Gemmatimonadaceae bacterium]
MTSAAVTPPTQHAPEPTATTATSKYSWYVVVLLLFAYSLSFLDRQILTLMVDPIRRSLNISDTQFSLLHGLAFAVFYTLLGLPLGRLADRVTRRTLIVAGVAGWSFMTMACGFARNFPQLFLARMGVGVGEAALSPGAYSIIADYFPKQRVARALSVYGFGIPLGIGVALMFGGYLVDLATNAGPITILGLGPFEPWQLVFLAAGAPGMVYAVVLATIREPRRRETIAGGAGVPLRTVTRFLADRGRLFVCFLLGLSILTAASHGTLAWVPAYFGRVHGWSASQLGLWLGLAYMTCGTLGLFAGGLIAERLEGRGRVDGTLRAAMVGACGALPFAAAGALAPSPWLSLVAYAAYQFFMMMPWGVASAAIQLIAPNEMRGQISALYLFSINIVGLGLGPTIVALLTDGVYGGGAGVRYSLVTVAAVLIPASAIFLGAGLAPFRRAVAQAQAWSGPA